MGFLSHGVVFRSVMRVCLRLFSSLCPCLVHPVCGVHAGKTYLGTLGLVSATWRGLVALHWIAWCGGEKLGKEKKKVGVRDPNCNLGIRRKDLLVKGTYLPGGFEVQFWIGHSEV